MVYEFALQFWIARALLKNHPSEIGGVAKEITLSSAVSTNSARANNSYNGNIEPNSAGQRWLQLTDEAMRRAVTSIVFVGVSIVIAEDLTISLVIWVRLRETNDPHCAQTITQATRP